MSGQIDPEERLLDQALRELHTSEAERDAFARCVGAAWERGERGSGVPAGEALASGAAAAPARAATASDGGGSGAGAPAAAGGRARRRGRDWLAPLAAAAAIAMLAIALQLTRLPSPASREPTELASGPDRPDRPDRPDQPDRPDRPAASASEAPLLASCDRPLVPLDPSAEPSRELRRAGRYFVPGSAPVELAFASGRLRALPGSVLELADPSPRAASVSLLLGEADWTERAQADSALAQRVAPTREPTRIGAAGGLLSCEPGSRFTASVRREGSPKAPDGSQAERFDEVASARAWLQDAAATRGTRARLAVLEGAVGLRLGERQEELRTGCSRELELGVDGAHTTDDERRLQALFEKVCVDLDRLRYPLWKGRAETLAEPWFVRDELQRLLATDPARWRWLRAPILARLSGAQADELEQRLVLDLLVQSQGAEPRELIAELWSRVPEQFSEDQIVALAERGQLVYEDELEAILSSDAGEQRWARVLPAAYLALRGDERSRPILEERLAASEDELGPPVVGAYVAAIALEALGQERSFAHVGGRVATRIERELELDNLEGARGMLIDLDFFAQLRTRVADARLAGRPLPSLAFLVRRSSEWGRELSASLATSEQIRVALEPLRDL